MSAGDGRHDRVIPVDQVLLSGRVLHSPVVAMAETWMCYKDLTFLKVSRFFVPEYHSHNILTRDRLARLNIYIDTVLYGRLNNVYAVN